MFHSFYPVAVRTQQLIIVWILVNSLVEFVFVFVVGLEAVAMHMIDLQGTNIREATCCVATGVAQELQYVAS